MADINVVTLKGRMTRDPELRSMPSGQPVASFSLANNRKFTNRDGELIEETNFIDCEVFGNIANVIAEHAKKGRAVIVSGRLRQDKWEDKTSGERRSKLVVKVEDFNFADSNRDRQDADEEAEAQATTKPAVTAAKPAAKSATKFAAKPSRDVKPGEDAPF